MTIYLIVIQLTFVSRIEGIKDAYAGFKRANTEIAKTLALINNQDGLASGGRISRSDLINRLAEQRRTRLDWIIRAGKIIVSGQQLQI